MIASKKIYSHTSGKVHKNHSSALKIFSHLLSSLYMAVIMESLIPISEECTKLLDCLSEPSSQLIHCIPHPLKEDILAKVFTLCFICVCIHGFASCVPTFCKGISLSLLLLSNHLGSKTPFKHQLVLNSSPLQIN